MNSIYLFKKEITKKYKKLDNEKLIELYNQNKIDELVNSLLPMVIYISNKFNYIADFEEIVSVGNIGLLKGIKKFDISKGNNIISVCNSQIRYSILDYLNFEAKLIKTPPIKKNTPKHIKETYPTVFNPDYMTDFDSEDEVYVEPSISRKEIEDLLMSIPNMKYSKIQVFLDYIFIEGITYREISENSGYPKQNVSLIIKDIISKIKKDKKILQRIGDMLKIN
jgi:RNA polymerase sporulation-specific sigma factor